MAPSIVPLMRCSFPVPLADKHPQSIMLPPPCLNGEDGDLGIIGSIPPPPNHRELSSYQRSIFWFYLSITLSPSSPLKHWQTSDGPVHVLSWAGGPWGRCRISVLHGVVTNCFLGDYAPSCFEIIDKILLCSFGLIPRCSHDHWTPRGEILHGAPVRGRLTVILCFYHLRNRTA